LTLSPSFLIGEKVSTTKEILEQLKKDFLNSGKIRMAEGRGPEAKTFEQAAHIVDVVIDEQRLKEFIDTGGEGFDHDRREC